MTRIRPRGRVHRKRGRLSRRNRPLRPRGVDARGRVRRGQPAEDRVDARAARSRRGPSSSPTSPRIRTNPARIIPIWRQFVGRHAARDTAAGFGIGEPVWNRRAREIVECPAPRSLLNTALRRRPAWKTSVRTTSRRFDRRRPLPLRHPRGLGRWRRIAAKAPLRPDLAGRPFTGPRSDPPRRVRAASAMDGVSGVGGSSPRSASARAFGPAARRPRARRD